MDHSIEGKTAIVTGAANGIGLAIARRFVKMGANVVLADMDESKLDQEVNALANEKGSAVAFAGNLREKLTVNNLMAVTMDAFDGVDILVNASRQVIPADPLEGAEDVFETLLHQNVIVNLRMSQAVAKRMIAQHPNRPSDEIIGSIINLSSIAAERTLPDLTAYSVATAALNQLTRSLAVAFARHGIRVNAIAMGSLMTASLRDTLRENEDLHKMVEDATPLGYIAEADQAADAAAFLACDKADFITGQIMTIDGGRSLCDTVTQPAH